MVITSVSVSLSMAPTPTSKVSVCKIKGCEKSGFIITGVDSKVPSSLLKSLVHGGVQMISGSVFIVMLVSGTAMVA